MKRLGFACVSKKVLSKENMVKAWNSYSQAVNHKDRKKILKKKELKFTTSNPKIERKKTDRKIQIKSNREKARK